MEKKKDRPLIIEYNSKGENIGAHSATDKELRFMALSKINRMQDRIIRQTGDKKRAKKVGDALQWALDQKISDVFKRSNKKAFAKIDKILKRR